MRRNRGEREKTWLSATSIGALAVAATGLLAQSGEGMPQVDGSTRPSPGSAGGSHVQRAAGAELLLSVDHGSLPVEPGDFVVITLSMSDLTGSEAAGFQAFLQFNSAHLAFISGVYTLEPFSLPIITPIVADGEDIALAAGIDVQAGQPPTSGPADLALLTFEVLIGGCVSDMQFAVHEPPTRITDPVGNAIEPLMTIGLPVNVCPADIVPDCVVNVTDLLELLVSWGLSGVPADINGDGIVNVNDLLILLASWGPCL